MSLIKIHLDFFRSLVKNAKTTPEDITSIHPVLFYQVQPRIPLTEGEEVIEEVYFYKPIGSFVYKVDVFSNDLPKDVSSIDSLKMEFAAEETLHPLYHYNIETSSTGRIFPWS